MDRRERQETTNRFNINDTNAPDTDCNGQQRSNGQHEVNASEGRIDAQCDIEQSAEYGNATNATGFGFCGNGTTEQSQPETFGTWNRIGEEYAADTDCKRFQRSASERIQTNEGRGNRIQDRKFTSMGKQTNWSAFPTQSPICSRNDELSGRLDNITFSKWRQESIKGYGNAVVPELVFKIFQAIEKYEMMEEQNNKQ